MATAVTKHAMKSEPRDAGLEARADTHSLQLAAWDVPAATGANERFALTVGARCSAGCDMSGRELTLFDQNGNAVCTLPLGPAVWPGTEALYFVRAEAHAPRVAGNYQWQAKMAGWEGNSQHAAGSLPLMLRVVAAPEHEVTVKAIDGESQMPIANARVVMHPYRAVTDGDGIAKLKVAKGEYDVLVSGHRYLPYCVGIEVRADIITCAALDADRPDEERYE